jgi:hypothetical protein
MSYTINFYDSGTSGRSSSDTCGIQILYTPEAPQPSALPNSTPQPLKAAISRYRRWWSKDRRKYPRSGGGSGIAAPASAAECAGVGWLAHSVARLRGRQPLQSDHVAQYRFITLFIE